MPRILAFDVNETLIDLDSRGGDLGEVASLILA